jgi:hypothetical protein
MLNSLKEIIGTVRLFDGMMLFLTMMLKDPITVHKVKRPDSEQEHSVKIQLTKILPPEHIFQDAFQL